MRNPHTSTAVKTIEPAAINRGIHSFSNTRTAGSASIARNPDRRTVMQMELAKKQKANISRIRIPVKT
jgi:hypothetical protein